MNFYALYIGMGGIPWIIDEALKRYIIPHHVHIGSHLAYFFLNYVYIGS